MSGKQQEARLKVELDTQQATRGSHSGELAERITAYLTDGGLFNPEMAIHDRVRDLLIECRTELAARQASQPTDQPNPAEPSAEDDNSRTGLLAKIAGLRARVGDLERFIEGTNLDAALQKANSGIVSQEMGFATQASQPSHASREPELDLNSSRKSEGSGATVRALSDNSAHERSKRAALRVREALHQAYCTEKVPCHACSQAADRDLEKVEQAAQQAMAEKAAQILLRIRNQMTDIVERERYNNIANQILDLPGAVEPPQDKLTALVAKWRKIAAECPSKYRNKWRDVFEAVETCADELERSLAGDEPHKHTDACYATRITEGGAKDEYLCCGLVAGVVEPPQDKLREAVSELHGRARKEAQRFIRSKTLYPEYHAAEVAYETVLKLIDAESNRLEAAAREPGASEPNTVTPLGPEEGK